MFNVGTVAVLAGEESADLPYSTTVERGQKLTRSQYLFVLTQPKSESSTLLSSALASHDPLTRRVAALQLSEMKPQEITPDVIAALLGSVKDADEDVSNQAVASLMRLGGIAPGLLLPLLNDVSPLRTFDYDSESANSGRSIDLTPADIAIVGLYYGRDINLSPLIEAYGQAVKREEAQSKLTPRDPAEAGFFSDFSDASDDPGSAPFFAQALDALLRRSPDGNRDVVRQLLTSSYPILRKIGYDNAVKVTQDRPYFFDQVASAMLSAPSTVERDAAAHALAGDEHTGRVKLAEMTHAADAETRGRAFGALLEGADCSSPLAPAALGDPDIAVLRKALEGMLGYSQGYYYSLHDATCLTSFITDDRLEVGLRERIIHAETERNDGRLEYWDAAKVEDFIRANRRPLADPNSGLYEALWSAVQDLVVAHPVKDRTIVDIAVTLTSANLDESKASDFVCALPSVDPETLASAPALVSKLVEISFGTDWSAGECAGRALGALPLGSSRLRPTAEALMARLARAKGEVRKYHLDLMEKRIPAAIVEKTWRDIASAATGTTKLDVYRIVASRNLAGEEALKLFVSVLSGDLGGIGARPSDYDLEYNVVPSAVAGLGALGASGRETLGAFIAGRRGTAKIQASVIGALIRMDSDGGTRRAFIPELREATRSPNPDARDSAAYALSQVLTGQPLVDVLRPLFNDSDKNVLYNLVNLLTANGYSDEDRTKFAQAVTSEDAETIVTTVASNNYQYLRGYAPELLIQLRARVPHAFVADRLKSWLHGPDQTLHAASLECLGKFGPTGVAILREQLDGPNAAKLLGPQLTTAISDLAAADRQEVLPGLKRLFQANRDNPSAISALGIAADGDQATASDFERQLASENKETREAALRALSARRFFSSSSPLYLAAMVDQRLGDFLDSYLGNVIELVRPYRGLVPQSGRIDSLPPFPWPPPTWSFKEIVPPSLIGADTLGQVADRLAGAVRRANVDYDFGYFGVPGGYVMLVRLERIQEDGTPLAGKDRWNVNPIPPQSFDEYLRDLFFSPPGYFRVIAFAVTTHEPVVNSPDATLPSTSEGAKGLPEDIAKQPFANASVYALVYTFQRYNGAKLVLNYDGSPSGLSHLDKSGIWPALQSSP